MDTAWQDTSPTRGQRHLDVTPAHIRNTEPLVKFLDVEKSYDGAHARGARSHARRRPGEFLTLLGPSGSGKTTTLIMLAGFERPTRGEILLGGRPVDRLPPYERNIGMVFQNYALFPHMTVGENVAFPLQRAPHAAAPRSAERGAARAGDGAARRHSATASPRSSRAASSSASPWPARWCSSRASC